MQDPVSAPPASGALIKMLTGHWVVQALYVTARLGIADLLRSGPRGSADLAAEVGAHEPSLYRLLRALTGLGVLREDEARREFELTDVGQGLRSDIPGTMRDLALMSGEEQYFAWGRMLDAVKSGTPAFHIAHGKRVFEYLGEHPASAQVFDGAMSALATRLADSVTAGYDFSRCARIVDLGGGKGTLLGRILKAHPHLRGTLLDLPFVVPAARAGFEAMGVADRAEIIAGDFFATAIPRDCDAYILSQVLFNWPDDKAVELLGRVREAMPASAVVLIVENVIDRERAQPFAMMMDLQMMAIPGGAVRTDAGYDELLARAGLRVTRRETLSPPLQARLLEARRPT